MRASCDPNEISVSPAGHITAGTQLEYTVHFENTGTDTAYNIYVMDTLSDYLDPSTFRMVSTSVPEMYISKMKDAANHTIMKLDFPGINLLDSSYHNLCNAMFIYTIKTKAGLPDCTHIISRAGIYFDYNSVCMTNEAESIIGCWPSSVSSLQPIAGSPEVYPNPASDELTIKMENGLFNAYSITTSIGTTILSQTITQPQTTISIKALPKGIYYVNFKGNNGTIVKKFVKM